MNEGENVLIFAKSPRLPVARSMVELIQEQYRFYSIRGDHPRFVILGGAPYQRLLKELRENYNMPEDRAPVQILGLLIVRVEREAMEVGF